MGNLSIFFFRAAPIANMINFPAYQPLVRSIASSSRSSPARDVKTKMLLTIENIDATKIIDYLSFLQEPLEELIHGTKKRGAWMLH
jgi:hypothetical protein